MKKYLNISLVIMGLMAAVSFGGCKADPCDLLNCAYSGACDKSTKTCVCEVGYEGIHCATVSRDKFVEDGTYSVKEEGTFTPPSSYTAVIVPGDVINEVRLQNVRNGVLAGQDVIATVRNDTLWIASQVRNGYEIEGMGIIEGKNPVSGSDYYQDATIKLTYKTTHIATSVVDEYGTGGTDASDWSKD